MNFAITIFGMRHPDELVGLLDNLEAVARAKAGAKDGSVDPDPMEAEKRFEDLKAKITASDVATMNKVAVAAISLISIFHIDQLPALFPKYASIGGGIEPASDMQIIKTVAIWAVN